MQFRTGSYEEICSTLVNHKVAYQRCECVCGERFCVLLEVAVMYQCSDVLIHLILEKVRGQTIRCYRSRGCSHNMSTYNIPVFVFAALHLSL